MLDRIVGHQALKERFARTLRAGRLASTYLFVGPEGIGKRHFAEQLAAALVCETTDAAQLTPCGHCEACQLSAASAHPDVLRVARPDGKSTLPVELFIGPPDKRHREGLCHELSLRPMRADRRVAIIDDADHFSVETANCLLKTLEEPPPRSLIVLIGASQARQLATIRSRSQVVRFQPLADQEVREVLRRLDADGEKTVPQAGGSVARALALADGTLLAASERVLTQVGNAASDPLGLARVLEEQSKAAGTEPRQRRRLLRELLATMAGRLHQQLVDSSSDPIHTDRLLTALDAIITAEESLTRNANQSALVQRLSEQLARAAA